MEYNRNRAIQSQKQVTTSECFKHADADGDGQLSIEEFKSWFYAPRNDPAFMFAPMRTLLE